MAKSDKTSQNPQSSQRATDVEACASSDTQSDDGKTRSADAGASAETPPKSDQRPESREARIRRIQADVQSGKYDSDELLEQALEIMLKRMSSDTE